MLVEWRRIGWQEFHHPKSGSVCSRDSAVELQAQQYGQLHTAAEYVYVFSIAFHNDG